MAEPFTQQEYKNRKGMMECIEGMHTPPYDSEYDQMTVGVGEMLRLVEDARREVTSAAMDYVRTVCDD